MPFRPLAWPRRELNSSSFYSVGAIRSDDNKWLLVVFSSALIWWTHYIESSTLRAAPRIYLAGQSWRIGRAQLALKESSVVFFHLVERCRARLGGARWARSFLLRNQLLGNFSGIFSVCSLWPTGAGEKRWEEKQRRREEEKKNPPDGWLKPTQVTRTHCRQSTAQV